MSARIPEAQRMDRGAPAHAAAPQGRPREPRFPFGENWLRLLEHVDEERVRIAERSLRETLGIDDLSGRTFLDAGSGSGPFSLAATRLGAARVHSFDFDPDSVACTRLMKERFAPDLETWTIEAGDVTDAAYCASLGGFDVVYCFGVLHSAGAMWQALDNLVGTVASGGLLFVSIYNHQGRTSKRWRRVKRLYNRLPNRLRPLFAATVWLPFEARYAAYGLTHEPRTYLRTWTRRDRGMSKWHDIVDWVGGYPFEFARPEQVFDRCRAHGLELVGLATVRGRSACNEFVFRRSTGSAACAD
ncbi:MAG: class I SAM-dependent methyltransferase [Actinomycetota bacterium]